MLLRDLLNEARERNRKLSRAVTNRTYYNRTRVMIDACGTDAQLNEFIQGVTTLMHDQNVQIEVL